MAFEGKIVSFDKRAQMGLIVTNTSSEGIFFMAGDVQSTISAEENVVGRRVEFDVVRTDRGLMAVNIHVVRRMLIRPGEWLATILAPLMVAGASYWFYTSFFWPFLLAYLVAINLVCFIFLACLGLRPPYWNTQPSDAMLFLLSLAGGAVATLAASIVIPSKWQHDAARFFLLVMVIGHVLLLHTLEPEFLSRETIRMLMHGGEGEH